MILTLCVWWFLNPISIASGHEDVNRGRAYVDGPRVHDVARFSDHSARNILMAMFKALEAKLILPAYEASDLAEIRASLSFDLPAHSLDPRLKSDASVEFGVHVDGHYTPTGAYLYDVEGDLGDLVVGKTPRRQMTISHDFKAFSDTPQRSRSRGANLQSFRSYALRHLGAVRVKLLDSGLYKIRYEGTGIFGGRQVEILRIYKPGQRKTATKDHQAPMPVRRMWTFWQDGGYELWVYLDNHMPAALFYTNVDDNIFANLTFDYDPNHMPRRIALKNNSVGFEGQSEIQLDFDTQGLLRGFSINFEGFDGQVVRGDADIVFTRMQDTSMFRMLPPLGYKKTNKDHLKMLLTTQIAGGLLQLKQHGVNIRNFKF